MKNKKKILVIDDNVQLSILLDRVLSEHFDVKTFNKGLEAVAWLAGGNDVDLILTDISMEEVNGLDLLKNLKASGIFGGIPVVILSAFMNKSQKIKGLQLGAAACLSKPFDPDVLINTINYELYKEKKIETTKSNSYE